MADAPDDPVSSVHDLWDTVRLEVFPSCPAFRPHQIAAVQALRDNRDVLAVVPTGSGKSVVFQLFAATRKACSQPGIAYVICPINSLIEDQVKRCPVPCIHLDSQNTDSLVTAFSDTRIAPPSLVFCSPEALRKHAKLTDFLLGRRLLSAVFIDEAHCLSTWGQTFRFAYSEVQKIRFRMPYHVPFCALTATADADIVHRLTTTLIRKNPCIIQQVPRRTELDLRMVARASADPLAPESVEQLQMLVRTFLGCGIVYCHTRAHVEKLSAQIDGSLPYHAGMAETERKTNQQRWIDGSCRIMCATVAFGMGIDKSDVRFVIHSSLPPSSLQYMQEIGRAARDGTPAACVCLYHSKDTTSATDMDALLTPRSLALAHDMLFFANDETHCRHELLDAMMCRRSPSAASKCSGRCDNCRRSVDNYVNCSTAAVVMMRIVRQYLHARRVSRSALYKKFCDVRTKATDVVQFCAPDVVQKQAAVWNAALCAELPTSSMRRRLLDQLFLEHVLAEQVRPILRAQSASYHTTCVILNEGIAQQCLQRWTSSQPLILPLYVWNGEITAMHSKLCTTITV